MDKSGFNGKSTVYGWRRMAKEIKFKFNEDQPHQSRAVESTVSLFKDFEEA
jgi:hypothetical protein